MMTGSAEVSSAYQATWASGVSIQFRLLTWKEFRYVLSLPVEVPMERDLWVYRRVILQGPPAEEVTAGVVAWLSYYLIENSPFRETAETVGKFRKVTQQWFEGSYLEQARALICGTFRYTFEEVDDWDQEIFFQRLIAAEMLVGKRLEPVAQTQGGAPLAREEGADPYQAQLQAESAAREQQKNAVRKHMRDRTNARRLPK